MSLAPSRTGNADLHDHASGTSALLLSITALIVSIIWQAHLGPGSDVSWLITLCERILGGARLYVDVVETNPPFTVWLYMPAVYLADFLGLTPEYVVRGYAYAVCLVGLGLAGFIIRRGRLPESPRLHALAPACLALLVIFPGNSFTQREIFGVALLLPLLALMAWRATANRACEPDWWLAIVAGLCGSVIVLVKPYYAVVVVAPALAIAWKKRSIKSLFSIEYWVICLVCIVYLASVFLFQPEFIYDIYPILADTYMQAKDCMGVVLKYGAAYLVSFYILHLLRPGLRLTPLVTILVIASLAAIVPLVYQGKGWPYHAYPAVVLMLLALLCRLAQPAVGADPVRGRAVPRILLVAAIAVNWLPFAKAQTPGPELVSAILAATDRPSVAVIGSGVETGHPLTRMVGGRWISAYCSDWLGGIAYSFSRTKRAENDGPDADRYEKMTQRYLDLKAKEFEAAKPDLVFLQRADETWNRHVFQQAAFSTFMQDYRFLVEDKATRVYIRNGYVKDSSAD